MNAHERGSSWPNDIAHVLDAAHLSELAAFSDEELGLIVDGIERLEPTVADASRTIIQSWDGLDGPERLAALVAFAEALANVSR